MRTDKSIKNTISSVLFTIIVGLLGFVKVRVFTQNLSNDVYSLNQLFYQIFSYLSIADIGFSLLLNKHLYKAFSRNDKNEVNKIYSTSKKFYNIIGMIIFITAILITYFVPFLTKANLPNFYIQLVFLIFIIRNVIDYFFIAPRFVLEADQEIYKVNYLLKGIRILETILEIILVLLGCDYLIILIPGIIITIIVDICVNKIIYKKYPWLNNDKSYNKKYLSGTKDIIWHRATSMVNSNTDIIIISAIINPFYVVVYSSYCYITKYLMDIAYLISNSITPSYANLLLTEDSQKSFYVFNELNILFEFIASFIFIMLFLFFNELIAFWVGAKYVVSNVPLFLFCFITFQVIAEKALAIIINSKGLFKETKVALIIECILNIFISLATVKQLGITGVLLGTVISKVLVTYIYNPVYIYKNIFNKRSLKYFVQYIMIICMNLIIIIGLSYVLKPVSSIIWWVLKVGLCALVVLITLFIIYYIIFKSFKNLVNRFIFLLKQRRNNNGSTQYNS